MENQPEKKNKFCLKWPWNLVVYAVLVLVLRIFAIPVICLLMSWNKKQQPEGPAEGYCRQRTRQRLTRLVWALLFLLIAVCCGVYFIAMLGEDRTGWELTEYVKLAVGAVVSLGALAMGLYEGYTDIRDAFCPEKSRLAKSIRSQLPYPDEAPGVKELFAMVDQDIRENGQWFDRVAIGKTWVLGDEVSAISRIRVVFGRDEIKRRYSGGRTQTTRIIELYIMDDRKQVQITDLKNPGELEAAITCLKLRAPDALFRPYSEYANYCSKTDNEWQDLDREFRYRHTLREQQEEDKVQDDARYHTDFILTDPAGRRTSRVTREALEEELRGLDAKGRRISLEPTDLIPVRGLDGAGLSGLFAEVMDTDLILMVRLKMADGSYQFFGRDAYESLVRESFVELLEQRQTPDFSNLSLWRPLNARREEKRQPDKKLIYCESTGLTREFTSFSRRDVELAGEGLSGGKYRTVVLYRRAGYIYLQAGDKADGRVTVNAGQPEAGELRVFECKCTDRQAREWLLDFEDEIFNPDFSEWKDITKKLEKAQKNTKNK